ncbi:MAG: PIN domain-containing protein [Nitriliruptorales bacterium]|nr:PIN domain-containing protein [Nitriliruptorales bacterium]
MIFVDTNVFMYAVGRPHALREQAQEFFATAIGEGQALATSAEVLQELVHAYLPVGRLPTLDAALELATGVGTIWPLETEDILLARSLVSRHGGLGARDLIHLACCLRREVRALQTYDRGLAAAFRKR